MNRDLQFLAAMRIARDPEADAMLNWANVIHDAYERQRELQRDAAAEPDEATVAAVQDIEVTLSWPCDDASLMAFYTRINDVITGGVDDFRIRVTREVEK